jgi:hypothetical protein
MGLYFEWIKMNKIFKKFCFFNQILNFVLYIINVSRTVLAGIGLAWPVGDRPMCNFRIAHLKSCAPRTVQRSTVYWIIVHVLDWFKYQHNLLINGLLTVKAGWGVYCFVVVRGGGDAGSGAPDGGPDPRPEACRKIRKNNFITSKIKLKQLFTLNSSHGDYCAS